MVGANYMGGKRNAAKARSKDSTGRIQKDFFGRRRLDMLSNGLANRTQPIPLLSPTRKLGAGISAINLAHARSGGEAERSSLHSYIPGATRVPSTPRSERENHVSKVGSSSGSSRSSRVLDALDTEPLFVRQTLNRILALPDLACLPSRHSHRPKRSTTRGAEDTTAEPDRKRQKKSDCQSSSADRRSPHLRDDQATLTQASPPCYSSGGVSLHHSLGDDSPLDRSEGGYQDFVANVEHRASSPRSRTSFPKKGDGAWPDLTPLKPSYLKHQNSPNSLVLQDGRPQTISSLPPSSEQGSSDYSFPDSRRCGSPDFQVIKKRLRDQDLLVSQTPPPKLVFSSNNLYEHEDPWHTIGVILGLSPRSPRQYERRCNPVSPAFTSATPLTQSRRQTPDSNRLPIPRGHSVESNASFDALSYTNFSPSPAYPRTPSPMTDLGEIQSPFRILLESKMTHASLPMRTTAPVSTMLDLTEYDDSDTGPPTSPNSRRLSALVRSRADPDGYEEDEQMHSPFRLLLEARNGAVLNKDPISALSLIGYGNSDAKRSSPATSGSLWKQTTRPQASTDSPYFFDSIAFNDNEMANRQDDGGPRATQSRFVTRRTSYQALWKHTPAKADAEDVFSEDLYSCPTTIVNPTVARGCSRQTQNFVPSLLLAPSMVTKLDLTLKEVDGVFQGPCLFPEDDGDLEE